MEKFSLDKWLKDKSRKVVTRRGNPVRIICTDRKHGEDDLPIVFLEENNGGEFLLTCRNDGRCDNYDTQYDLFFADEEEKLTEFESNLANLFIYNHPMDIKSAESIAKRKSKQLLDLARKEVEKSNVIVDKDKYIKNCDYYYEQGKQDALKDLPKWKKTKENRSLPDGAVKIDEDGKIIYSDMVWKGEYFIMLQSLKTLPKEEQL